MEERGENFFFKASTYWQTLRAVSISEPYKKYRFADCDNGGKYLQWISHFISL